MPVVMAVILISVPGGIRLGSIVDTTVIARLLTGERRVGSHDCAALLKVQVNLALEANRETEISSRGKDHHSSAHGRGSFDGTVDGFRVHRLAVPRRAIFANIENSLGRRGCRDRFLRRSRKRNRGNCGSRHAEAARAQKIAAHRIECLHRNVLLELDCGSLMAMESLVRPTRCAQLCAPRRGVGKVNR